MKVYDYLILFMKCLSPSLLQWHPPLFLLNPVEEDETKSMSVLIQMIAEASNSFIRISFYLPSFSRLEVNFIV